MQCIFVGLCHLLLSCGGSPAVPDCHVEVNPPPDVGTTAKPLSSMLGAKHANNHACDLQHHQFKAIPSMCIAFRHLMHFPSPWLAQHRSRRPPPSQVPAASRRTTEGEPASVAASCQNFDRTQGALAPALAASQSRPRSTARCTRKGARRTRPSSRFLPFVA